MADANSVGPVQNTFPVKGRLTPQKSLLGAVNAESLGERPPRTKIERMKDSKVLKVSKVSFKCSHLKIDQYIVLYLVLYT